MIKVNPCIVFFVLVFIVEIVSTGKETAKDPTTFPATISTTTTASFVPYRYDRHIFIFLSTNVTSAFLNATIFNKLIQLDNYCGGEDFRSSLICGDASIAFFEFFDQFSGLFYHYQFFDYFLEQCRNESVAPNVSSGTVDRDDVKNISRIILAASRNTLLDTSTLSTQINVQFILITDYATESLKSNNITNELLFFKEKLNATFIVLASNLSASIAQDHFPQNVWTVVSLDYTDWTPESGQENPICGYELDHTNYTTPSPSFSGDFELWVYLFVSSNYINSTRLESVISLLVELSTRRWLYPCRQYRNIRFIVEFHHSNSNGSEISGGRCILDDLNIESNNPEAQTCSASLLTSWLVNSTSAPDEEGMDNMDRDDACYGIYDPFFISILNSLQDRKHRTYLVITDLPMLCSYNTTRIRAMLNNYTNYAVGAPLTVIAIDKDNEKSVANSWAPIFPSNQLPNLYEINRVDELLENKNKSINFCLDFVPWIDHGTLQVAIHEAVWQYYLIGAIVVIIFVIITMLIIWRIRTRKKLREIAEARAQLANKHIETTRNQYELALESHPPENTDLWEVSLNSIDIDYMNSIGKGAFSVVYSGFLRGKAPVLNIFPSIALQQFSDCVVAVKTLPQHSDENAKAKFRSEINLMKEIGYHVHLVSILGCNCSIERPILIMERAIQNLLHWLVSKSETLTETEVNLEKTLLSISWQIADGMSYLSSKRFVHRDLAARNILLTSELKAMVSDFGLCERLEDDQVLTIPGGKLPLKWMALESLQEQKFSKKTDVWSFGILLFEIFSLGQEPYGNMSGDKLVTYLQQGNRLKKPKFSSDQIYEYMKQCWHVNAAQRPDFSRIQSHLGRLLEDGLENYGYLSATEKDV